ncbi:MAG: hypothetical protein L0241_29365 [Planctomycetia bacterium]|nr:hypothetical protein [Planctomycetia bacterium]
MNPVRPFALCVALLALALGTATSSRAADDPPPKGQRVFSAGHSFHVFMPAILTDMARSAGIKNHTQVGISSLGGSRTIRHWNLPDDKNKTKIALKEGKVDVLTLSPIFHPDEGIDNFTKLGLEHNEQLRVLVQAFWLPFDVYDVNYQKKRPERVDRNTRTVEQMKTIHAEYFTSVDDQVQALNKKHGKRVVFIVPVGQAAILLRGKIIEGKAPGLKSQEDLFRDAIGHAHPPLQVLTAYCHFAVIYRRSPVGLSVPVVLKNAKNPDWNEKLNTLLQELAWEAVTSHPLSGVKAKKNP